VEVRLGKIGPSDISRYRVLLDASSSHIEKLLVISMEIDRDISLVLNDPGPPIQVITFEEFIQIIREPKDIGFQGLVNFILSERTMSKDIAQVAFEQQNVEDYIISTFGTDFFTKITEDDASMSIFTQNRDILGESSVAMLLVGTTNTGKSSIANVLFGENILVTGAQTDVTGEIALIRLKSDVVIFDTPGVGGTNDQFENRTRFFLGLKQIDDFEKDESVTLVDLTDPNIPQESKIKQSYDFPEPSLVLVVFDMAGGFKRHDRDFFREVQTQFPRVLLIGNKSDRLSDEDVEKVIEDIKVRIKAEVIPIATKPDDGSKPVGMKTLVKQICYNISENAITSFNRQLITEYEREEGQLVKRISTSEFNDNPPSITHRIDTALGDLL
jgi:predicted GTPase